MGELARRERLQLINHHRPRLLPCPLLAPPSALPGTSRSGTNRNGLFGAFGSTGATSTRHEHFCAGSWQALGTFINDRKRRPEEQILPLSL